ncbi:discoidin domain-containing protein, partial [Streptomyces sp. NPDC001274]
GSWQLAETLISRIKGSGADETTQTPPKDGGEKAPAPPKPLRIASATEFMPNGSGMKQEDAPKAIDGDAGTAWVTYRYQGFANFGNLPARKDGSGIVVDLGSVQDVSAVEVRMYRSGQKAEVLAAGADASAPSALADFPQRLTPLGSTGSELKQTLDKPVRTRYVLVHITELPPDGTGGYRGGISEISVLK